MLRHGESENNVLGIDCTDISNKDLYGLTTDGIEQIERVASEQHDFDIILHSPLRRAVESARILSRRWGTPSKCEGLLIEVNMGVFENRPEAERRDWKKESGLRFHPSEEPRVDVEKRAATLLNRIRTDYRDQNVLLVTHGSFLFSLFTVVFDQVDWSEYCEASRDGRCVLELKSYGRLAFTEPL